MPTIRANYELRLYEGQNRFDVVCGTVTQWQHSGHSRSAERQHVPYSVLLQRLRWCGDWRTKLYLYPATLSKSYAIYHSESNSYIHANAYSNGHSNFHAYSDSHAYADCDGYCNGNVHAHGNSNTYSTRPRLRLLRRQQRPLLLHRQPRLPRLQQLLLLRPSTPTPRPTPSPRGYCPAKASANSRPPRLG